MVKKKSGLRKSTANIVVLNDDSITDNSISNVLSSSTKQEAELPAEKAMRLYEKAKILLTKAPNISWVLEKCLSYINAAITILPTETKFYIFMAKIYRQALDFSACIYCLRYVIRIDAGNNQAKKKLPEILILKGRELMRDAADFNHNLSFYWKARQCFNEALKFDRDNIQVYILKAICHVHAKEFSEALDCIFRAQQCIGSMHSEVYVLKGKIYWAQGLMAEGNKELRNAVTLIPKHPEVIAFSARSFIKSEKLYKLSLEELTKDNYTGALKFAKHAISITKDDIKLHILASKLHRTLGNLKDGYSSIQYATEIYQASGQDYNTSIPEQILKQTNLIFNDMALKLAGEGEYEKAVALFNKIIHSENDLCKGFDDIDYRFHLNRGDCFRALHKLNQALSDYSLALSLHPNDWDIKIRLSITHYLAATDFYNTSDYYEAEIELCEAIEYNPKVYEYYIARGKCRYYLGMFHEAYNDYKVALTFNPTNEDLINRIKQFESDDPNLVKNDEKKKATKLDNDGGTKKIEVDNKDMVQMMLEPNKAKKLPYVRLLHDSHVDKPIILGPKAESYLPKISPHMTISLIANQEVSQKVKKLHKLLETRPSNKKDAVWSMFDEVRASVKRSKKIPESLKKKGNLPMTAAALKKMSLEASKKAMLENSSLVAGVTAKNDGTKASNFVIVPRTQSKVKGIGATYDPDDISLHSDFRSKSDRNSVNSNNSLHSRGSIVSRGSAILDSKRPNSETGSKALSKEKDQGDEDDDSYEDSDNDDDEVSDKLKLFNLLGENHHYVHDDSHPDTVSSLLLMSEKDEIKILKKEAGIESSSDEEEDD